MITNIKTYELPDGAHHYTFQIHEVEGKFIRDEIYPHKTDLPHRHSYYEICIFINGAGKHEIDFNSHSINAKSLHFISPGQVHLISREDHYHGYLIVFSKDFYSLDSFHQNLLFQVPYFNNHTLAPILNLNDGEFEELMQLVIMMKNEYLNDQQNTKEILRSYLQVFLLKCKQFYFQHFSEKEKMQDPQFFLVQEFKKMVEIHYKKFHLVQEYAESLALSPSVLNKHVKRITGFTAGEIIIDRLLLQAKRLLIYSDLSHKEIAYRLNYEDPSYFSRIFKKKTSYSPSEFRKVMAEKYQF